MDDILTIGSVVRTKLTKSLIMIVGIKQQCKKDNKSYDYAGLPYPQGYVDSKTFVLFNNDDIEEIVFLGFVNAQMQVYLEKVMKLFNDKEKGNG